MLDELGCHVEAADGRGSSSNTSTPAAVPAAESQASSPSAPSAPTLPLLMERLQLLQMQLLRLNLQQRGWGRAVTPSSTSTAAARETATVTTVAAAAVGEPAASSTSSADLTTHAPPATYIAGGGAGYGAGPSASSPSVGAGHGSGRPPRQQHSLQARLLTWHPSAVSDVTTNLTVADVIPTTVVTPTSPADSTPSLTGGAGAPLGERGRRRATRPPLTENNAPGGPSSITPLPIHSGAGATHDGSLLMQPRRGPARRLDSGGGLDCVGSTGGTTDGTSEQQEQPTYPFRAVRISTVDISSGPNAAATDSAAGPVGPALGRAPFRAGGAGEAHLGPHEVGGSHSYSFSCGLCSWVGGSEEGLYAHAAGSH